MKSLHIPVVGLLFLLSVQHMRTFPLQSTALTNDDMGVLKFLLQRLEESIPAQDQTPAEREVKAANIEETRAEEQPDTYLREYLSARDLKTVRKDSKKKNSGCFGSKLDRIGSMSSLGCNTVGRSGPKKN
ncbi:natriuretic peptides B precursor [Danio rerio]|uniref:Natriuretic peptide B n=1 Tax=Danio rerio TaxID=7955 RepID=F1R8L8_DANRE|nr:natriuretic peptides B precursor [Danio rerio]|eukprot:NP_001314705.1 natriuretic peptide B precursor [Danio rerio]